jgi:hypothetical protein
MDLKLGRNPGHIPVGLRDLTYYKAGSLPTPPGEVTVPQLAAWGMDGNDHYGDCGIAGYNHGMMVVDSMLSHTVSPPDTQALVNYYLGYTLGQDNGVVLADFLAHVKQFGFFTHTLQAYAPVAVHDIPTLQFAVHAYGFAYTGIRVTERMMANAQNTFPVWDVNDVLLSPTVGGHCIPIVGYDSRYLYCVTWGKVVSISYPAWHYMSDEAWACIPGDFTQGDGRGIDLAALQADLPSLNLG